VPQVHLLDLLEVGGINRDWSSPIVYKILYSGHGCHSYVEKTEG
jgi:hypothetical protein